MFDLNLRFFFIASISLITKNTLACVYDIHLLFGKIGSLRFIYKNSTLSADYCDVFARKNCGFFNHGVSGLVQN